MPDILLPPVQSPTESPDDRAAREILQRMTTTAEMILQSHQWIFDRLWNSSDASPDAILAKIGTRGEELFERGGDTVRFLLGADTGRPIAVMQPSEYTPPIPYTVNPDGSVTLDWPT